MDLDDPKKPEFATWHSYLRFANHVRHLNRFVWSPGVQAFLDTVASCLHRRKFQINAGEIYYRAQPGISEKSPNQDGMLGTLVKHGHGEDRMRPLPYGSSEGRANPAGISVLYLANYRDTAISEIRPWIGYEVSVAQFRIERNLAIVDLTGGHGQNVFQHLGIENVFSNKQPSVEQREQIVWIEIDNAFSKPVSRNDDIGEYIPTQILSELFKSLGYDGLVYRSQFGEFGVNVVLFNGENVKFVDCTPYRVSQINVAAVNIGNADGSEGDTEASLE